MAAEAEPIAPPQTEETNGATEEPTVEETITAGTEVTETGAQDVAEQVAKEAVVATEEEKPLSVFDQYWNALEKSPRDFDTWVSLLSLAEQNAEIEGVRKVCVL
ncbi:hypothetical protein SARC_16703 [Sphaeroforma arctica JP610]|uniref:Uncharacterized protein n=1 Tax=Sphaeroforma arctica JP610 TaxID=667725 RepID=A0A0L0F2C5_9EUKA|nr:hypothetical protein SARC_16703 [Sphaeroforma arctica JP610]KNC70766.1 hypothetical protein SARC_16703 [Sphaeroforma arctica JP610]|eukprot:XP_014144668.1 hypothetical protein SARC_16703 [Sphaeroforma arctica JP610]